MPYTNSADRKRSLVFSASDHKRNVFNRCCLKGQLGVFHCRSSSPLWSWNPGRAQHCRERAASRRGWGCAGALQPCRHLHGVVPSLSKGSSYPGLAREGNSHCSGKGESLKLRRSLQNPRSKMKGKKIYRFLL